MAKYLDSRVGAERSLALGTLDLLSADEFLTAAKLVQAAQDNDLESVATELLVKRPQIAKEIGRAS